MQDKTFRKKLLEDVTEKGYFLKGAFFEQLPKVLVQHLIQTIVNVNPKLTATQARSLALAGRPGISTYFQVAIGAAHFNATRFLDYVRAGKQLESEWMLTEDPGLLTLKDVEISKLFLHMLRGESAKAADMRKKNPDLLPDEELEISQFLVYVSTGNLLEARKMLQKDPTLVLKKGRLVDFGLRRFVEKSDEKEAAGIYPMQYADAQDDVPMKDLLKRNWPAEQTGEIAKQLEEKGNSNYKALEDLRHSIGTVRDALAAFIDITKPLDTLEKYEALELQLEAAWREFIKAELKLAPRAIHLWREEGNPVAWHDVRKNAPLIEKSRNQENITWWYDNVGSYDPDRRHKYGVVRGDVRVGGSHEAELLAGGSVGAFYEGWRFMHDLKKLSQLSAPSQAAVPKESHESPLPARRFK